MAQTPPLRIQNPALKGLSLIREGLYLFQREGWDTDMARSIMAKHPHPFIGYPDGRSVIT